jgi:putative Holliday junction resolvase
LRAIGVDLGAKRIGIALSDSGGTVATPWTKVDRTGDRTQDHKRIAALADEGGFAAAQMGGGVGKDFRP